MCDLLHELLNLQEQIMELNLTREKMEMVIKDLQKQKLMLEQALLNQGKEYTKTKRKKRDASVQVLQRFYHQNKSNPTIIQAVKDKIKRLGYSSNSFSWHLVKLECNSVFNTLSDTQKEMYSIA